MVLVSSTQMKALAGYETSNRAASLRLLWRFHTQSGLAPFHLIFAVAGRSIIDVMRRQTAALPIQFP